MRKTLAIWLCCAAGIVAAMSSLPVLADAAGVQLAQKVYDRPNGKDSTSVLQMTLTQPGHAPRVRRMVSYRLERGTGEIATLIRFTDPEDIAGTGLLTLDHSSAETDQWVYLPAMDRVRRISSSRKSGRFVNSEYYYDDLRDRKVSRDLHRIAGHEVVNGIACDVLESIPVEAGNSAYLKRVSWIDPATLIPMRVDLYEKNLLEPNKRLSVGKVKKVQGFWTVMDTTMTELASGNATRLVLDRIIYDRKLPSNLFSTEALEDESLEEEYRP